MTCLGWHILLVTELRLEIGRIFLPGFLYEMDEFLEKHHLPKLVTEEMENLHNSLIIQLFSKLNL